MNPSTLFEQVLLPYQMRWMRDQSRFKIGLWARQTGKDFTCMAEAVWDCVMHPRSLWVVLAPTERQALESLQKARKWATLIQDACHRWGGDLSAPLADLKSSEILWSNQSRLVALPGSPETARGYSGNIVLTEFAFHENDGEIWRAIYPSITNPLSGRPKRLRIISTPNGCSNKFHELWFKGGQYSRHFVTIHDAVAQGLNLNVEELRDGLHDPEGWAREYECEFRDQQSALLPYDLITSCEDPAAAEHEVSPPAGRVYAGIDFGRKQDLTVCWTLEEAGRVLWTREVLVLERMATPEQLQHLRPRVARAARVCLDYTGSGVGLGDFLAREFGGRDPRQGAGKVELCHFTQALKGEIFPKLRMAFEERRVRIPAGPALREDLHGLQRVVSPEGQLLYRAFRSADGHSDRCTALALAVRAAGENSGSFEFSAVRPPRWRTGAWG